MYSVFDYGTMMADSVRSEAYALALRRTVRPGGTVLEIGTGAGLFALVACQMGAARVYAVEPADVIQVAREAARANGCADRIEFIQARSRNVSLPEPASVIISDLRGVLPPFQQNIPDVIDTRDRLLAPGGALIARTDTLWAAAVEADELHRRHVQPWSEGAFGLDLKCGLDIATSIWRKAKIVPEQLVTEPATWTRLDYRCVTGPNLHGTMSARVTRRGTANGLGVWFDSELAEGVTLSNAPGEPELIYGQAFFPWPQAVTLEEGDSVDVVLRADLVGEDYVWGWETAVRRVATPNRVDVQFRQSNFLQSPLSAQTLARRSSAHVPRLSEDGLCARFVLERMDGASGLESLAHALRREFPGRFPSWQDGLNYVSELSARYSQ